MQLLQTLQQRHQSAGAGLYGEHQQQTIPTANLGRTLTLRYPFGSVCSYLQTGTQQTEQQRQNGHAGVGKSKGKRGSVRRPPIFV